MLTPDETSSEEAAQIAAQGRLLTNIQDNVNSGRWAFSGGRRQFDEWRKRAEGSVGHVERQALLIEADRLMRETRQTPETDRPEVQSKARRRKWMFWKPSTRHE